MKTKFQFVGGRATTSEIYDDVASIPHEQDGVLDRDGPLREQLRGQPKFKGFCGPMWGGWMDKDGEHVFLTDDKDPTSPPASYSKGGEIDHFLVRYETWEAYEVLSR